MALFAIPAASFCPSADSARLATPPPALAAGMLRSFLPVMMSQTLMAGSPPRETTAWLSCENSTGPTQLSWAVIVRSSRPSAMRHTFSV
jgi:hypothetical protein